MINFPFDFDNQHNQVNHPESFVHSIGRFYSEICKMPALIKQARIVDQVLLNRLNELKQGASTLMNQFKGIKPTLLSHFAPHLFPLVQKVLDELLVDAEELKQMLERHIVDSSGGISSGWENYAECWIQWYKKWENHHVLQKRVLEKLVHHATHLINKDVQLIKDYQTHSLSYLHEQSEEFKRVNQHLAKEIEEPLGELMALRERPQEWTSLEAASEWVSNLSKKREMYVDCILMKIDYVIKEDISSKGLENEFAISEFDEEVNFMNQELYEIQINFSQLHSNQGEEKEIIKTRLKGLLDHIEQLQEKSCLNLYQSKRSQLRSLLSIIL